jgi:hypothetical protein
MTAPPVPIMPPLPLASGPPAPPVPITEPPDPVGELPPLPDGELPPLPDGELPPDPLTAPPEPVALESGLPLPPEEQAAKTRAIPIQWNWRIMANLLFLSAPMANLLREQGDENIKPPK